METRKPVVAGQFYPSGADECINEINECLMDRPLPADLPEVIVAGIVPHAGWIFSGSLAAMVFNSIKQVHENVDTFIIFGAVHSPVNQAVVYDAGYWSTPLGQAMIDTELADQILKSTDLAIANRRAHSTEHSIEVQVPFIQHLFKDAKIVPIMVPPVPDAMEIGTTAAKIVKNNEDKKIICIGSTDLTHYGPRYGFNPQGTGEQGIKWAKEVNDQKFIDAAVALDTDKLINESGRNYSSCGPGAAAAAIQAAKELGSQKGRLLAHTHSTEIMMKKYGQSSSESVGYAAMIF